MKSERRHELQTNDLAGWLGDVYQRIRPYLNAILGGGVLVVVVVVTYVWWSRQTTTQASESWQTVFNAMNANDFATLEKLVDQNQGTPFAQWVTVAIADLNFNDGSRSLFIDKTEATAKLSKAVEQYNAVLKQTKTPMLLERATFGLARTLESQGKLEEARQAYQQVQEKWPEGAYAKAAESRFADLAQVNTQEFYDKIKNFNPKAPVEPPGPPPKGLPIEPPVGKAPLKPLAEKGKTEPSEKTPEKTTTEEKSKTDLESKTPEKSVEEEGKTESEVKTPEKKSAEEKSKTEPESKTPERSTEEKGKTEPDAKTTEKPAPNSDKAKSSTPGAEKKGKPSVDGEEPDPSDEPGTKTP
jgi:predicted negative regulator of RcsB-dependent stress response